MNQVAAWLFQTLRWVTALKDTQALSVKASCAGEHEFSSSESNGAAAQDYGSTFMSLTILKCCRLTATPDKSELTDRDNSFSESSGSLSRPPDFFPLLDISTKRNRRLPPVI